MSEWTSTDRKCPLCKGTCLVHVYSAPAPGGSANYVEYGCEICGFKWQGDTGHEMTGQEWKFVKDKNGKKSWQKPVRKRP